MADNKSVEKRSEFRVVPDDFLKQVGLFQTRLNNDPDDRDVEVNDQVAKRDGGKIYYVPVGAIERKLDELFSGLYSIECREVKQIANELLLVARIEYFHPVAGVWLHRDGVGGAQIRWRKDVDITDLNGKLKNAIVADAPHAYAEAIKNAAKKIGNLFGRNLNRDDDYSRYEDVGEFLSVFDEVVQDRIREELEKCETVQDFKDLWAANKELQEEIAFKKMFLNARKKKGV